VAAPDTYRPFPNTSVRYLYIFLNTKDGGPSKPTSVSGTCHASDCGFGTRSRRPIPISELLILGLVLGPTLEESLFRGCLPVLAQSAGTIPAVIITAVIFAVFHEPTNLAHWLTFTATGIAYGWVRMASGSTTAPALMQAAYNLTFGLLAGA